MSRKPVHEAPHTLQAIEDHAFELFGRYGYDGVSIGDIAKATRLSKGALYWHFRGKEDLYLHCLTRLHTLFDQVIFDPMRSEPDPLKAVLAVFTGLRHLMQDPRVEKGVAGYWLIPSSPEASRLIDAQRSFERNAVETLREVLRRGHAQGVLDFGADLDDMARAMISQIQACLLPLRHLERDEVQRILSVLARTLFRAYAVPATALTLARAI